MRAVGSGFFEKTVHAKTAYKRVAPERDTHRRMRVEIDWLEYESRCLHNLMRLRSLALRRCIKQAEQFCACFSARGLVVLLNWNVHADAV